MTAVVLTPAAQADVDDIWTYTAGRWGEAQAVAYVEAIRDACRELVAGTRISRSVDVRPGYRKAATGSHMIFFKADTAGNVAVVRILHKRADVGRHL